MTVASRLGWFIGKARLGERVAAESSSAPGSDARPPLLEWRLGLRMPGRRYYVNIRIGHERRTATRLLLEGQKRVPLATVFYCSAGAAFFLLFGIVCFVYLLKSMAGINLLGRESWLHPLYGLFFE